jgi:hypothetical protein
MWSWRAEPTNCPKITYAGFIRLMITDEHPCRPFDAHAEGSI